MADVFGGVVLWMLCFGLEFRYKGKRYVWSGHFCALVEKSVYDRAARIAKLRKLYKRGNK